MDPARIWPAPFSGAVIVRGAVSYNPPPLPSDVEGRINDIDDKIKKIREKDDRDGAIFTVELNAERHGDAAGKGVRCFAATLNGGNKSVQLSTPAAGGR